MGFKSTTSITITCSLIIQPNFLIQFKNVFKTSLLLRITVYYVAHKLSVLGGFRVNNGKRKKERR